MIKLDQMTSEDMDRLDQVLAVHGIRRQQDYFRTCYNENLSGERVTLLASIEQNLAGVLHILWKSHYPYFREHDIPEINDLIVIPPLRRCKVATALLDCAEKMAFERYGIVGLGVGLYQDYGPAQRLYARRGYLPDGHGLIYAGQKVTPGTEVRVDDELLLYLVKAESCGESDKEV